MTSEANLPAPPDDPPMLAAIRPVYRALFHALSFEDCCHASVASTMLLGCGREGFTYVVSRVSNGRLLAYPITHDQEADRS